MPIGYSTGLIQTLMHKESQSHQRITMLKQMVGKAARTNWKGQCRKRTRSLRHRLLNSKQPRSYCGRTVSRKISESDGQEFAMYPRDVSVIHPSFRNND